MRSRIADAVQGMYADVASGSAADLHFPVGRDATLLVGYPFHADATTFTALIPAMTVHEGQRTTTEVTT